MNGIKPLKEAQVGDLIRDNKVWVGIVIRSTKNSFVVHWLVKPDMYPDLDTSRYNRHSGIYINTFVIA